MLEKKINEGKIKPLMRSLREANTLQIYLQFQYNTKKKKILARFEWTPPTESIIYLERRGSRTTENFLKNYEADFFTFLSLQVYHDGNNVVQA